MRLHLVEDQASAFDKLQDKILKNKKLSESDFEEITDSSLLAQLLDPKDATATPTGINETIVKEQFIKMLFEDKFDNVVGCFSIINQSLDSLGADKDNNLFLYYILKIAKEDNIELQKEFANLVHNFVKSGKITKRDIDTWLSDKSLYTEDGKKTQYKIETLLFLKKQNGAKEYNLKIKDDSGKYRLLKESDLYEGTTLRPADEIRDILQQAQQTGEEEKDTETVDTKAQEKIIKNVISAVMAKNPKFSVYDLTTIVKNLATDEDTEDTLLKKVTTYIKKKGTEATPTVKQTNKTDAFDVRLLNALVAAGYDKAGVKDAISTGVWDKKDFGSALKSLVAILDSPTTR